MSDSAASAPRNQHEIVPGRLLFVGAGLGARHLTLAAVDALNSADVVVLPSADHRALIDHPTIGVADESVVIAATDPARHARGGHVVVVVVPGDPLSDPDVARTASLAAEAGHHIAFVPGLQRRTALPAYTGLSLDDPFIQMITANGAPAGDVRWAPTGPLVIDTDTDSLEGVVATALASNRRPDEPTSVTLHVGSADQRSVDTTLADVLVDVAPLVTGPADTLVVIGHHTARADHESLNWFESQPLLGWQVLVPRTKDQAGRLTRRLEGWGAAAHVVPTIAVEPPRNPAVLDKAVHGLVEGRFEWVAFTSANAVRAVREKFEQYGLDARAFSGLKVAVVGQTTADAVRAWGIEPDLVPAVSSAQGLGAEFPDYDERLDPINRVLLPRADIATEVLSAALIDLGWEVEDVVAYRTVRAAPPPVEIRDGIKAGRFDAVTFTSSSTVRNLIGIAGKPHTVTIVVAIGPQTAEACREHGLRVDVVARDQSSEAMADALAVFAAERREHLTALGKPVVRPSEQKRRGRVRSD